MAYMDYAVFYVTQVVYYVLKYFIIFQYSNDTVVDIRAVRSKANFTAMKNSPNPIVLGLELFLSIRYIATVCSFPDVLIRYHQSSGIADNIQIVAFEVLRTIQYCMHSCSVHSLRYTSASGVF